MINEEEEEFPQCRVYPVNKIEEAATCVFLYVS